MQPQPLHLITKLELFPNNPRPRNPPQFTRQNRENCSDGSIARLPHYYQNRSLATLTRPAPDKK